jgi:hypothetical protein
MVSGKYGTAAESYPVQEGETWSAGGVGRFRCCDFLTEDMGVLRDLVFAPLDGIHTDPPWNDSILRQFYKFAGKGEAPTLKAFLGEFLRRLKELCPTGTILIDFGLPQLQCLKEAVHNQGLYFLGELPFTYGHARTEGTTLVVSGAPGPTAVSTGKPHGLQATRELVTRFVSPGQLWFDPCCGVGLLPLEAVKRGALVCGTEIIPRKLANTLQAMHKRGARIVKEGP